MGAETARLNGKAERQGWARIRHRWLAAGLQLLADGRMWTHVGWCL